MSETVLKKEVKKDEFKPTQAQTDAIDHRGSDLLISAGAGSGKTATLTDRIAHQICDLDMDISRMLVVTYTIDAANELKIRIAKKLSQRLAQSPKNAHLCEQIVKVSSADISTIHSFCLKVIKPNFDKLGLDSGFRIGEETELEILKQETINEIIEEFYEGDTVDPDFLLVSDCYSEFTDDSTLGTSLLALYNQLCSCAEGLEILLKPLDRKEEFLNTGYGKMLTTQLRRIVEHYKPHVDTLYSEICSDDNNDKYFNAYEELYDIFSRLEKALEKPSYETFKAILGDYQSKGFKGGRSKKIPTVDPVFTALIKDDISTELKKLRKDYFYADRGTIESTYRQNEKICRAMYSVLSAFDKRYKEKKQKHSLCDFNDLERYTLELFYDENGEISTLAKEFSKRYDQLYIDEYQDVNSIQDKIFKAIERNNRFMVGDIKQSIYSFRAAEPQLFSRYRDSFIPYVKDENDPRGKTIFMSDNFRCDPAVIKATNHMSDYMFTRSHGFSYVHGDRLLPEKKHGDIFEPVNAELCIINTDTYDSEVCPLDPQAEFVAREIKELLENGKLPNGDKIEPRHIAILLRKRKDCIERYIEALNAYGIKHEYAQEVNFYKKPHVLLLLCILNVVDTPSKDVYLAGAMRSGLMGFSLEELVKIKTYSKDTGSLFSSLLRYEGEADLTEKAKSFVEKIELFRKTVRNMAAHQAISYIMNETGFLSSSGKEERQDAIKLYNIAREYEQGSYKGLYSFLRYVEDVASKDTLSETVTADPQNSVKIITMHKSKGLEYEICFLCDTDRQFIKRSYTSPLLFSKSLGVCGYVSRQGGIIKYNNIVRKCVSLSIKEAELEESLRILYVAMTRARSKLYITGATSKPAEKIAMRNDYDLYGDEYSVYSSSCYLDLLLNAFSRPLDFMDVKIIDPSTFAKAEEEREGGKMLNSLDSDEVERLTNLLKARFSHEYEYGYLEKIPSKLSISTLYPRILDSEENEEYQVSYSIDTVPKFAASAPKLIKGSDRGTATHVFMQFCDFKNLLEKGVECELARLCDNSFISREVGELIEKAHLEKFRGSHMLTEFLEAKEIIREFRFNVMLDASEFSADPTLTGEKVLVQGVTDCLYEDKEGNLILVDYKTDRYDGKTDPQAFLAELRERHRMQLTYYKKACEMMFERKIHKVLVYSVPLADTVEID